MTSPSPFRVQQGPRAAPSPGVAQAQLVSQGPGGKLSSHVVGGDRSQPRSIPSCDGLGLELQPGGEHVAHGFGFAAVLIALGYMCVVYECVWFVCGVCVYVCGVKYVC